MTSKFPTGDSEIFDLGLEKWNNDKGVYKDCGVLVPTDYDDNYLNIGVSTINNTDSVWENRWRREKKRKKIIKNMLKNKKKIKYRAKDKIQEI